MGIVTILLQQDHATAPELAARFEVSARTILRDLEDLGKAGIPVVTTQGFGGGVSLAEGYTIEKSLLTKEELQTVLMGLRGMDSVSQTPYQPKLMEKLSRRGNRVTAEDSVIIDLSSHDQVSLVRKMDAIKTAIREHRRILFRYYYPKGESFRNVEPYHLVFKWSAWYVLGYCLDRKGFRLFKLNRLWHLRVTEDRFFPREVPAEILHFDGYFHSGAIHLKAVFQQSEKYRLIEEYGVDAFTQLQDGTLLLEREFASYDHMREWIFSFGDRVRILEPTRLQEDRMRQAKNILYGEERQLKEERVEGIKTQSGSDGHPGDRSKQ